MNNTVCKLKEEKITAEEMRDEVLAMLKVCFEGEAKADGDKLYMVLPDGEKFSLSVKAE